MNKLIDENGKDISDIVDEILNDDEDDEQNDFFTRHDFDKKHLAVLYPFAYIDGFRGVKKTIVFDQDLIITLVGHYCTKRNLLSEKNLVAFMTPLERYRTDSQGNLGFFLNKSELSGIYSAAIRRLSNQLETKITVQDLENAFDLFVKKELLIDKGDVDNRGNFYQINLELLYETCFEKELCELIPFLLDIQADKIYYQKDCDKTVGLLGNTLDDKKTYFSPERMKAFEKKTAYYDPDVNFYIIGGDILQSSKQRKQLIENLQKIKADIDNGKEIFIRYEDCYMDEHTQNNFDFFKNTIKSLVESGVDLPFVKDMDKLREAWACEDKQQRMDMASEALFGSDITPKKLETA